MTPFFLANFAFSNLEIAKKSYIFRKNNQKNNISSFFVTFL